MAEKPHKKNINKCYACGKRGRGISGDQHRCVQKDDFNDIYNHMSEFDLYIFITPVYFHEMSESAKTFFDRLKRCDAFNNNLINSLSITVNDITYDKNFKIGSGDILHADSTHSPNESLAIKLSDLVNYVIDKKIMIRINL